MAAVRKANLVMIAQGAVVKIIDAIGFAEAFYFVIDGIVLKPEVGDISLQTLLDDGGSQFRIGHNDRPFDLLFYIAEVAIAHDIIDAIDVGIDWV